MRLSNEDKRRLAASQRGRLGLFTGKVTVSGNVQRGGRACTLRGATISRIAHKDANDRAVELRLRQERIAFEHRSNGHAVERVQRKMRESHHAEMLAAAAR